MISFASVVVLALACRREQSAKPAALPPPYVEHGPDAAALATTAPASHDGGADAGAPLLPVEQAMARLVTAMVGNDPAGVLACFSKHRPTWLISSGVDGSTRKMKFSYAVVEKGMKTDGDFWYYFFDDDSELVRGVERNRRWPLVRGTMFVPAEYEKDPDNAPAGVRWRKEGNSYVIDAIFDSGS